MDIAKNVEWAVDEGWHGLVSNRLFVECSLATVERVSSHSGGSTGILTTANYPKQFWHAQIESFDVITLYFK